jgi:hypothetical protein
MFPYLMKFPNIIGSYMFTFLQKLPKDQYNMLIPKIELNLKSKDTKQKFFAIKFLGELNFDVIDKEALINSKIIEMIVNVLDFEPNHPVNVLVAIIKILYFFTDHFAEQENEETLKLMYRVCLKMLNYPETNYFLVFGECMYRVLGTLPKLKNFEGLEGKKFLIQMKQLLEENNEEKIQIAYKLLLHIQIFKDCCDHMKEFGSVINLIIDQMGNRLNLQDSKDSCCVILFINEMLEKDIFPWFDKLMTKIISILKREQNSTFPQLSYLLLTLSDLTNQFPSFMEKYIESPGFLDLILKYSLVYQDSIKLLRRIIQILHVLYFSNFLN